MEKLAARCKGLSDATRLRILGLLAGGELCVCDLMAVLGMPQSTVSRHLAFLRKQGWVEARRSGKWMHYRRPDQPDPFAVSVLALLDETLLANAAAREDARALEARLSAKENNSCGNGTS
ncbi:metalloregulator ArsR/SmtB family transcription factor [Pseudodesulfovibrio sp. F-1]|uniref:Metalloregulator ArsR/SmtB family transcription factor n=1 Tax=Pseudodesulfovibrio alkaliphilus TaxID=2661613 RepID=A0A7K1KK25_9BACT|nr:metalloregulator ArsR/SmtB family transcription factor [Pseudodesulfovibrio alkaliphilus]MUM76380.1 metalloregulator ArsR/SmtB family transcription factor [Pseudodesulfovibrio alkaliphilus]